MIGTIVFLGGGMHYWECGSCDQVQIVCVLYWNLNIAAEFVMSVPGVSLISASIDEFQCEKRRDYD